MYDFRKSEDLLNVHFLKHRLHTIHINLTEVLGTSQVPYMLHEHRPGL